MNQLAAIQKKLDAIGCPHCLGTSLDLRMRCDLGYHDVVYQAECERCHFSFEINQGSRSLADLLPMMEAASLGVACPHCGGMNSEMKLLCDIRSHETFYLASCNDCHKPFKAPKKDVTVSIPEGLAPGRKTRFNIKGTGPLVSVSTPETAVPPSPAGLLEMLMSSAGRGA